MTIHSMTGFARASGSDEATGAQWTWETRSVNGKGLDVRVRWPQSMETIEQSAKSMAQKRFKRGNMSLNLNLDRAQSGPKLQINQEVLDGFLALSNAVLDANPGKVTPPALDGLLALRGVLEPVEEEADEDAAKALEAAILVTLEEALTGLATMRAEEGARLSEILLGQVAEIEGFVSKARALTALQPDAIKARLKANVEALLDASPALSEERLAQEAAVLIVKSDVSEEMDRLEAHIKAARDLLAKSEPIGRKFDFLCQEFNREANTLCSKSPDAELTALGLELKTVIDQMREQVQNVE